MNRNLKNRIYTVLNNGNARTPSENTNTDSNNYYEEKADIYGIKDQQKYLDKMSEMVVQNASVEQQNTNIFGIPHQFLGTTDARLTKNNNFGCDFFYNIYAEKPVVTLMPGKMLFLPAYSKHNKEIFGSLMADPSGQSALKELISEEAGSRYYDFASDYNAYMNYVNLMCRTAAVFLDIGDKKGPGGKKTYKTYDWRNYHYIDGYDSAYNDKNSVLTDDKNFFEKVIDDVTIGQRCYVNFYIDPNSSVNESISNTTQTSQLEGAFDSLEGIIKEADMLVRSVGDQGGMLQNIFDKAESTLTGLLNTASFGFFKDLLGLGEEVLHGSNLIYPEIWTDSDYSKSFSIQINLSSPYGSKEAIYLNILVPMFHALCLALPRQSSENSFNSPFLIRGYTQGWFSIDMGMVDNITIDKGPEQSWSVEGLPTQVKITLNIKELYNNLMMSPSTKPSYFFANQGLIDYLGVTCGVDMALPNVYFKLKVAQSLLTSYVGDIPNRVYYYFTETWRNYLNGFID